MGNFARFCQPNLLGSVRALFINMHTGITPTYRGVHGAYWALVNNGRENCGVVIHLVDRGIDIGNVLYQATVEPTAEDNFFTYPFLQIAAGIPLLLEAVGGALAERLRPHGHGGRRSALWTHPTPFEYLRHGWPGGIW